MFLDIMNIKNIIKIVASWSESSFFISLPKRSVSESFNSETLSFHKLN